MNENTEKTTPTPFWQPTSRRYYWHVWTRFSAKEPYRWVQTCWYSDTIAEAQKWLTYPGCDGLLFNTTKPRLLVEHTLSYSAVPDEMLRVETLESVQKSMSVFPL